MSKLWLWQRLQQFIGAVLALAAGSAFLWLLAFGQLGPFSLTSDGQLGPFAIKSDGQLGPLPLKSDGQLGPFPLKSDGQLSPSSLKSDPDTSSRITIRDLDDPRLDHVHIAVAVGSCRWSGSPTSWSPHQMAALKVVRRDFLQQGMLQDDATLGTSTPAAEREADYTLTPFEHAAIYQSDRISSERQHYVADADKRQARLRWHQVIILLQKTTSSELYSFIATNPTSRGAVTDLINHTQRRKRSGKDDYPIVRLGTSSFERREPPKVKVWKPCFAIVGHQKKDDVIDPANASIAADLNDAIPY